VTTKERRMTKKMVRELRTAILGKNGRGRLDIGERHDARDPEGQKTTLDYRFWPNPDLPGGDLVDIFTLDPKSRNNIFFEEGACFDIYLYLPECPNDKAEDFCLWENLSATYCYETKKWTVSSEYRAKLTDTGEVAFR
jgi:hypothetical protein